MDFASRRVEMVQAQLVARGVRDTRVLAAMGEVPRELFLTPGQVGDAYRDGPLPIGNEQTISQPFIVAIMAAALELGPGDRVLEVGAGSGYAAAVLARLAAHVDTVERHAELAEMARRNLARAGVANVEVHLGDGTLGWPAHAPYDAISVAAASGEIPPALCAQLRVGGRLVMPIRVGGGNGDGDGDGDSQRLVCLERLGPNDYAQSDLGAVRFVPLWRAPVS